MLTLCDVFGHKITYLGIIGAYRDQKCTRCPEVVKGHKPPSNPLEVNTGSPPRMPICKPPKKEDNRLDKIQGVVDLVERWCADQENGMTDGSICISAMKDIRRIMKEK